MTALQRINHSTGYVLVHDDEHEHWSFRVMPDGALSVLGNIGYVGPVPDVHENPPPNFGAVHTIAYTEVNDDAFRALRRAIEVHTERYGACDLYFAEGEHPRELRDWVAAGAPDPDEVSESDEVTDEPEAEPGDESEPSVVNEVLESGVLPDGTTPDTPTAGVNPDAEVTAEQLESGELEPYSDTNPAYSDEELAAAAEDAADETDASFEGETAEGETSG